MFPHLYVVLKHALDHAWDTFMHKQNLPCPLSTERVLDEFQYVLE